MVAPAQPTFRRIEVRPAGSYRAYFADFLCRELKIIVEVDGGTHSTAAEIARDAVRTSYLKARGYRIFRAHNSEVSENFHGVLDTLRAFIETKVS